jgi:hypothetical protein
MKAKRAKPRVSARQRAEIIALISSEIGASTTGLERLLVELMVFLQAHEAKVVPRLDALEGTHELIARAAAEAGAKAEQHLWAARLALNALQQSIQTRWDELEQRILHSVKEASVATSKLADELAGNTQVLEHLEGCLLAVETGVKVRLDKFQSVVEELAAQVRLNTERTLQAQAPVISTTPLVRRTPENEAALRFCLEHLAGRSCVRARGHEGDHRAANGEEWSSFKACVAESPTRAEYGACMNRYYPASAGADRDVWYTCALDKGHAPPHTDGKGTVW